MNRSFVSSFIVACLASATPLRAADPAWWDDRGVKNSNPASNLSPATTGQAKHMAAMALEELGDGLPAAEFAALESDVAAVVDLTPFQPPPGVNPAPPPTGYVPVGHRVLLVGQLKALAKPFYDNLRLWNAVWLDNEMIAANIRAVEPGSNPPEYSPYPWSVATSDDQNMAVANLGHLKAVFSVRLETVPAYDTDGDGMPDAWEMQHGLDPVANDSGRDPDMDGLTNLQEFLISTDPSDPDSDGDLLPDGWENTYGFDPLTKDLDALTADPDGDGFSNFLESVYGTDPYNASSVPPGTPDVEIILPPPPPDDPPPPPPPPATAGADWHFEVVTARKYLPKYGMTEFIDSTPPKRYLLKSETVSFKLLGNEGENPESPINGARLTTVDPLTGGQTIEDHQHKGSNNERNDNMDGSVEPQTATAALGVAQVSSYDDEPNQRGDRNAIKTLKVVLDEENTNEMLVANVIAELPPYPTEYSDGSPQAYRDLLEDELGIDYQKASYRIVWNDSVAPEDRHAVSHLVVFEPEDDPDTAENESEELEIVRVIEWSGLGEESPNYEVDPESEKPGEDGRYFLLPVDLISDLNNDGQLTSADHPLRDAAIASGATDEIKAKGTEYILQDDVMSNGAWDNQDQDGNICFDWPQYGNLDRAPAAGEMDDDAIAIEVKAPSFGVAWFTHEAIGSLTFFREKECLNAIAIDLEQPFDLSTQLPERLWIKFRPTVSTVATVKGTLTFHIGKSPSEEWGKIELPLTLVPDFGCEKFFEAARNYIFERNTQVFLWDYKMPDRFNPSQIFRLCVMREEATTAKGYDAYANNKKGIGAVALAAGFNPSTVMVNGNQCFFSDGYDENSLLPIKILSIADACHGRVIIGGTTAGISSDNFDNSTKPARGSDLAGPDPIPVGTIAGNDGILGTADDISNPRAGEPGGKYLSQTGTTWNFAAGQATGTDAVGGLSANYASIDRSNKSHQMVGRVPGSESGKGCVFTATQIYGVGEAPAFAAAAKRSGNQMLSPSTDIFAQELFILDSGDGSLALQHIDPVGNLRKAYIGRKSATGFPYYVNNYVQFWATKPRP